MKPIYNYSPESRIYCGAGYADESPLEPGVFLIPANATDIPPPVTGANQQTVFSDGEWLIVSSPVVEPHVATLRELAASRCGDVDAEMTRRNNLPVYFGGDLFDADENARTNISGVLLRLIRGAGLPAGWVGWRDLNNAMHWSADSASLVLSSLSSLASEIEDRKQALFITAWTHKSALSALTTTEAVQSYDLYAGWPA